MLSNRHVLIQIDGKFLIGEHIGFYLGQRRTVVFNLHPAHILGTDYGVFMTGHCDLGVLSTDSELVLSQGHVHHVVACLLLPLKAQPRFLVHILDC